MTYNDFLRSKIVAAPETGFAVPDSAIHPALKPADPGVCRVVDGIPTRMDVDRDECLGNAVVPQQFYPIFRAIMEVKCE